MVMLLGARCSRASSAIVGGCDRAGKAIATKAAAAAAEAGKNAFEPLRIACRMHEMHEEVKNRPRA